MIVERGYHVYDRRVYYTFKCDNCGTTWVCGYPENTWLRPNDVLQEACPTCKSALKYSQARIFSMYVGDVADGVELRFDRKKWAVYVTGWFDHIGEVGGRGMKLERFLRELGIKDN